MSMTTEKEEKTDMVMDMVMILMKTALIRMTMSTSGETHYDDDDGDDVHVQGDAGGVGCHGLGACHRMVVVAQDSGDAAVCSGRDDEDDHDGGGGDGGRRGGGEDDDDDEQEEAADDDWIDSMLAPAIFFRNDSHCMSTCSKLKS